MHVKSVTLSGFKYKTFLFSLLTLFLLSACASKPSLLIPYPTQVEPVIAGLKGAKPLAPDQIFASEAKGSDGILYSLERGRALQITGQTDSSVESFGHAVEGVKSDERGAVVKFSDVFEGVASIAINDNVMSYRPPSYERTMLHTFQALNYLFKKDIENAAPEVRLAGDRQKADLDAHDKELEKQREKSSDKSNADAFKKVSDAYAGLDESAGKVKNAFQNAYAFYVSALVYEAHNEPDQAYKDYQNALEIFPENVTVQRDTIRLAKALAYTSDLAEYKKRFPKVFASVEGKPKSDGSVDVVVLFEDGLIPQRKQIKIPLPVNFKGGFTAVSWPTYTDKWIVPKPLSVSVDGGDRGQTDPIVYLQAIAAKALKDEIVGRVIREIIRAAAKGAAAYAVSKDNNSSSIGSIIGTIATSAYNVASENADLRSWLTLPLTAQVKRFRVHAGKHTFTFSHPATGARGKLEVEVSAKKLQIVRVIRVGTQIYSSTVGL